MRLSFRTVWGGGKTAIFIKGVAQYYFFPANAPFVFWDYLKPDPGFRAALGFEWRNFDFSLESGYTHFAGIDPYRIYVEDLHLFPLLFKFGYIFALPKGWGIQPEAGFGAVFYKTIHDSTIHPGPRIMQESFTVNMMASLRLNLVWEIPKASFLLLHIGGGADMIPETEGPNFIPAVEAGLTFKPRLSRRTPVRSASQPAPRPMTPTTPRQPAPTWNIHFIENTEQIVPTDYPLLEKIANAIKQLPANCKIQLDGHVAAWGRPDAEMDLSFWRGQLILEALSSRGIADERIYFLPWGSTKPLMRNDTTEGRYLNNRVEITVLTGGKD
ncbi:hypothetical protein AGMMS49944_30570 [Spirochaetia bacterium]|nr:hypothetical protein AGMMS49944_30570 [Spirochaetia bacterium]